jgi:hypothetical protein
MHVSPIAKILPKWHSNVIVSFCISDLLDSIPVSHSHRLIFLLLLKHSLGVVFRLHHIRVWFSTVESLRLCHWVIESLSHVSAWNQIDLINSDSFIGWNNRQSGLFLAIRQSVGS